MLTYPYPFVKATPVLAALTIRLQLSAGIPASRGSVLVVSPHFDETPSRSVPNHIADYAKLTYGHDFSQSLVWARFPAFAVRPKRPLGRPAAPRGFGARGFTLAAASRERRRVIFTRELLDWKLYADEVSAVIVESGSYYLQGPWRSELREFFAEAARRKVSVLFIHTAFADPVNASRLFGDGFPRAANATDFFRVSPHFLRRVTEGLDDAGLHARITLTPRETASIGTGTITVHETTPAGRGPSLAESRIEDARAFFQDLAHADAGEAASHSLSLYANLLSIAETLWSPVAGLTYYSPLTRTRLPPAALADLLRTHPRFSRSSEWSEGLRRLHEAFDALRNKESHRKYGALRAFLRAEAERGRDTSVVAFRDADVRPLVQTLGEDGLLDGVEVVSLRGARFIAPTGRGNLCLPGPVPRRFLSALLSSGRDAHYFLYPWQMPYVEPQVRAIQQFQTTLVLSRDESLDAEEEALQEIFGPRAAPLVQDFARATRESQGKGALHDLEACLSEDIAPVTLEDRVRALRSRALWVTGENPVLHPFEGMHASREDDGLPAASAVPGRLFRIEGGQHLFVPEYARPWRIQSTAAGVRIAEVHGRALRPGDEVILQRGAARRTVLEVVLQALRGDPEYGEDVERAESWRDGLRAALESESYKAILRRLRVEGGGSIRSGSTLQSWAHGGVYGPHDARNLRALAVAVQDHALQRNAEAYWRSIEFIRSLSRNLMSLLAAALESQGNAEALATLPEAVRLVLPDVERVTLGDAQEATLKEGSPLKSAYDEQEAVAFFERLSLS